MYCGQTVGRIKMKLDMDVRLGPGHIVLDGDPAPLPKMGTEPAKFSAHVYCGQTAAWIKMPLGMEVGLGPGHIMVTQLPSLEKGHSPQIFGRCCCGQNGWMDQNATWYDGRHRPRPHCVTWGPKGHSPLPNFRLMSTVTKRSPISATAEHLFCLKSD